MGMFPPMCSVGAQNTPKLCNRATHLANWAPRVQNHPPRKFSQSENFFSLHRKFLGSFWTYGAQLSKWAPLSRDLGVFRDTLVLWQKYDSTSLPPLKFPHWLIAGGITVQEQSCWDILERIIRRGSPSSKVCMNSNVLISWQTLTQIIFIIT